MLRAALVLSLGLGLTLSLVWAAGSSSTVAKLSATQIVERNIAARGGLNKWHAVQAMTWSGTMQAGGVNRPSLEIRGESKTAVAAAMPKLAEQPKLPFVLQMQRPRKSRLELQFNGQTAVQVYDGTQGWKLRPFLNRNDAEPFTTTELQAANTQTDLDGALIDSAANGTKVELVGTDSLNGSAAYKLKLTFKDRRVQNIWVDAQSFLEVKMEGTPRRLDGKLHPVTVYLSDYRAENGLQIAHLMESKVDGVIGSEKIFIDKVVVNPLLDASAFAKPQMLAAASASAVRK